MPAGPGRYGSRMDQPALSIADEPGALRYEARRGDDLVGFVEYRWIGGRRVLLHTEVLPPLEGTGVGSAMARFLFEDAVASGSRVTVKCPFLRAWLERHPEYAAIITAPQPLRPR